MKNDEEQQPEKNRFLELFNLFPKGNPESAFTVYKYAISSYRTFDGNSVTHDLIKQKWIEYINFCQMESRNTKYIKSFEKFITDKDFNTNFSPKVGGKSFLDKF